MSLMRLLTNGKTLVDVKRSTSRYQIPTNSLLPKFGPVKNPFTPPVSPAPRPAASPVVAAAVEPKPVLAVAPAAPAEPKPAVKIAAEAL
ncbi:MAG: hypothetical protein U1F65_07935, partial [Verrucomicrobiota bacterium]